ncbi:MAG: DUF481 domain-containing protein [Flavobacterium sp.]|uniref:DUF481 domain-containing protein n=1 Tax=Flavobacterium sp. TaxID=239 RepID=UPI003BE56AEC
MKISLLLYMLIIVNALSYGQLVNIENQRVQSDSLRTVTIIDLQYNYQNNNDEELSLVNFSATHQYKTKNLKNYFLLLGNIDYSLANREELSNSGLIHFRYNRKLIKKLRIEAFIQYQYNKILGIESRSLIGIGPRYKINKSEKIIFYIGSLLMQEFEKATDNTNIISYQRLSNYLSLSLKNTAKTLEFTAVVYYQPNINLWKDYRISSQASLAFNITSKVQFVNSINYGYDSYAPSNVSKKNIILTNGLKMNL